VLFRSAASKIRPSCVVLWDPVLHGARHLAELRRLHGEVLADGRRYWRRSHRETPPSEILGFQFGESLLAEVEKIDIASGSELPRVPVCLVQSSPSSELSSLQETLRSRKIEAELHTTEMAARWLHPADIEELLLPADAVRTISDFLERRAS